MRRGRRRLRLLLCGAANHEWSCQQEHKGNRFMQDLLSLQYKIHRELLGIILFKTCDRIDGNVSVPAKLSTAPNRSASRSHVDRLETFRLPLADVGEVRQQP